jgi:hypothetical protein
MYLERMTFGCLFWPIVEKGHRCLSLEVQGSIFESRLGVRVFE